MKFSQLEQLQNSRKACRTTAARQRARPPSECAHALLIIFSLLGLISNYRSPRESASAWLRLSFALAEERSLASRHHSAATGPFPIRAATAWSPLTAMATPAPPLRPTAATFPTPLPLARTMRKTSANRWEGETPNGRKMHSQGAPLLTRAM